MLFIHAQPDIQALDQPKQVILYVESLQMLKKLIIVKVDSGYRLAGKNCLKEIVVDAKKK